MMDARSVGRSALDRWLKAARFPFDAVTHLLPADGRRNVSAVLLIDRADASVRAVIGRLFHDDALLVDATRRQVAVDERVRAMEIGLAAAQAQQVADAHLADGLDAATRVRASAEVNAREASKEVEADKTARKRQAQADAAAQERAGETAKEKRLAAAERKAKRERLNVLDEQAKALDEHADALTAADEARRLADATADVKAARKGTA
jgi:hypothetical protein